MYNNNPFVDNPYQSIIKQRHIDYLVHFTRSCNLPFILGNEDTQSGILSSTRVQNQIDADLLLDKQRLDHHSDYVCCSVERINKAYYEQRKKDQQKRGDVFNQWAVLFIDPSVIDDTTLFCPTNAASSYPLKSGPDAFNSLFQKTFRDNHFVINRDKWNIPSCYPTDYQAEVLIKNKIPKNKILGVAFPPESETVEIKRLGFCDVNFPRVYPWRACYNFVR